MTQHKAVDDVEMTEPLAVVRVDGIVRAPPEPIGQSESGALVLQDDDLYQTVLELPELDAYIARLSCARAQLLLGRSEG